MLHIRCSDWIRKAGLLAESARFDLCGACALPGGARRRDPNSPESWVYPAALPDGRTVRLLKVLQTNVCSKNCLYCANRVTRDIPRETLSPEELARLFDEMRRARLVQGLFLSSAISGCPDRDMARMTATAEILRGRYKFHGYIHLKILPGASREAIERAARLADRISINLEAPGEEALRKVAGQKRFSQDILQQVRWIHEVLRDPGLRAKSHTTQFVVGAAQETDRDILAWTERLYRGESLARAYFSAYQIPDPDTPLDSAPAPLLREHRLYQADFLLRKYGFRFEEMVFESDGNLSLALDPKQAWAQRHPETFPVDLATAPRELLLRVPGIGPVSAAKICKLRKEGPGPDPAACLRRLGVVVARALPYCLWKGRALAEASSQEVLCFEEDPCDDDPVLSRRPFIPELATEGSLTSDLGC